MFQKIQFQKPNNRKHLAVSVLIGAMIFVGIGCSKFSNKQKGAVIGGTTGGVIGGVIGKKAGNTAVGAIVGAAVGGAAGIYIGDYMDKQAEELDNELENAEVERVGEGIHIFFDSGILFAVDSATLTPQSQKNLIKFAEIQQKYEDTNLLIEGHTDSTGEEEYNLALSRRRAQAVADYLTLLKVNSTRFTVIGYGESMPKVSNDTTEGRQANRRVEIAIIANEDLKAEAKAKTEG